MTVREFRDRMERYRRSVEQEARALRDSYIALDRLHALYRDFGVAERTMADKVLAEWALSDDEGVRFDALVLISDFKVVAALPALRTLSGRLAASNEPSAPYELQKVVRILDNLSD